MIEGPTQGNGTYQVHRRARGLAAALGAIAFLLFAPTTGQAKSFPVTTTANSGTGSLRAAIEAANAASGPDVIPIGVTGTINLESALPGIAEGVEVKGPGATSLTVRRNSGSFGIFSIASGVSVSISGIAISNGRASQGAGIDSLGALVLERVTVSDNEAIATGGTQAVARGGGITSFGPLTLRESAVSGNIATASEGTSQTVAQEAGVAAFDTTLIERSTISGNVASASSTGTQVVAQAAGLALFAEGSTIDRSTVSGNSATASGGSAQTVAQGGGVESGAGLLVTGSTITGNGTHSSEVAHGANLILGPGSLARDTIVSDPLGAPSCAEPVASGGFNIDDGSSCRFFQPTDLSFTNPGLNPALAANGGPTLTHALLPGSAAIDRGNAFGATTDQRGLRRPSDFGAIPNAIGGDGSDIGAFEEQDLIAPTVKIERGPLPRTRQRLARFFFSADEPGSALQCRIDQQPFASCTSPFVRRVRRNRTHTFEVEATDVAGNRGQPAQRRWRVKRKRRHHHRHHHQG
jgi:hypothetical protein